MKYGNLTIIGTSHIAKESVNKVKETILAEKPDVVAVELDHARLHALFSRERPRFSLGMLRMMGISGFVFFIIGSFLQRRLGKLIGTAPGEEMKTAVEAALQNSIRVALIDQPLNITMRNLSGIRAKEKLRLVKDFFFGISGLEREKVHLDLTKTPSSRFVQTAMKRVKERYPGLYKALVTDRNEHMARMLVKITEVEPHSRIVAIVGAGHEEELLKLVKKAANNSAKVSD